MSTAVTGCVSGPPPETYREPEIVPITRTQTALQELPAPSNKVPVAVYAFDDQTGQFKPQENVQTLSRAVSQGGASILVKALRDAGNGAWFTVLERSGLDNLLKERQIIQDMRLRYLGERQVNPQALPPLLFAGMILEGGIVGFDSNTLTGGLGARFMGIGGDVEYRQNTVTVNLRAVSVKTGEVLANVTVAKTLASVGIAGGAFKFVDFDELLEVEAGLTNNEPGVMALRRAIEKAVYSLIIEGADSGLWQFADPVAASKLIRAYRSESTERVVLGDEPDREVVPVAKVVPEAGGAAAEPEATQPAAEQPVAHSTTQRTATRQQASRQQATRQQSTARQQATTTQRTATRQQATRQQATRQQSATRQPATTTQQPSTRRTVAAQPARPAQQETTPQAASRQTTSRAAAREQTATRATPQRSAAAQPAAAGPKAAVSRLGAQAETSEEKFKQVPAQTAAATEAATDTEAAAAGPVRVGQDTDMPSTLSQQAAKPSVPAKPSGAGSAPSQPMAAQPGDLPVAPQPSSTNPVAERSAPTPPPGAQSLPPSGKKFLGQAETGRPSRIPVHIKAG